MFWGRRFTQTFAVVIMIPGLFGDCLGAGAGSSYDEASGCLSGP